MQNYNRGIEILSLDSTIKNQRKQIPENFLCEAIDCFERATEKIELKIDDQKTITIFVCVRCKSKFVD
jgi:hypothetical protein